MSALLLKLQNEREALEHEVDIIKRRLEERSVVQSAADYAPINCMPHYPPPGLPWGHSGDLSPPVIKFPNTGANSAVNSLTKTPVTPCQRKEIDKKTPHISLYLSAD